MERLFRESISQNSSFEGVDVLVGSMHRGGEALVVEKGVVCCFPDMIRFGMGINVSQGARGLKYQIIRAVSEDVSIFLLTSQLVKVSIFAVAMVRVVESGDFGQERTGIFSKRMQS